jgi:hypothetical protein
MNTKIPREAKAGFETGITTVNKNLMSLQPSISAASLNSLGIVRKNCLRRKIPMAPVT